MLYTASFETFSFVAQRNFNDQSVTDTFQVNDDDNDNILFKYVTITTKLYE